MWKSAEFCGITTLFNPARFRSRIANYRRFAERLAGQGVPLLTVELAFGEEPHVLVEGEGTILLRGSSVMWQKERLINVAIENLPEACRYVAWLDGDLLFPDGWAERVVEALQTHDLVQPFERVINLPPAHDRFVGESVDHYVGIACQALRTPDWLRRRRLRELPFAVPGFAWAAPRERIAPLGLYDRLICGNGDAFFADCCLDSLGIHHYARMRSEAMIADMERWRGQFLGARPISVGYVPIDVHHLWHGSLADRGYRSRDEILLKNDFDPTMDIRLSRGVYEWSSDKPALHREIADYFVRRKEDDQ